MDNIDVVRRIYREWTGDGTFKSSELFHPDIEWVNPPDAVEPGTRRGVDDFLAAAGSIGHSFGNLEMEFDRFIDAGDDVVVIATLKGTGRGSGADVQRRQGYIWTIEDGRAIRFRWFNSPAAALEAAGLSEERN